MLHISTQDGYGTKEVITPLGIANGEGDRYLIRTNREIAEYGKPTYVRFLAEMNQTNNGYSAYNRDGSSRGAVALDEGVHRRLAARDADPARRPGRRHRRQAREAPPAAARHQRDRAAGAAGRDGLGAADRGHAEHRTPTARGRTGRASSTSTGSAPTSTRSSPTSRTSRPSTTTSRACRSCSASGRCGAPTARASCTSSSSS